MLSRPVPAETWSFPDLAVETRFPELASLPGFPTPGQPEAQDLFQPAAGRGAIPTASLRLHIEAETFAGDIRTIVLPNGLGWQ